MSHVWPGKSHPFGSLYSRALIGLPVDCSGFKIGEIVGSHVVVRGRTVMEHLLPSVSVGHRHFSGRLACTVDHNGYLTIATDAVLPGYSCFFEWEKLVQKPDFYLTRVTIEELDTTLTGDSVRMPLEASDVDFVLRPYAGDLRVDPALVKALFKPSYSFPVCIGIVTRIIRSHGEAVMIEVTTVGIDKTGAMKGRLPDFCMGENKVRRALFAMPTAPAAKRIAFSRTPTTTMMMRMPKASYCTDVLCLNLFWFEGASQRWPFALLQ